MTEGEAISPPVPNQKHKTMNPNVTKNIEVRYENSWYGYQGHDGFALYLGGKKMHIGLFVSVSALRDYWKEYMPLLVLGIIPYKYR